MEYFLLDSCMRAGVQKSCVPLRLKIGTGSIVAPAPRPHPAPERMLLSILIGLFNSFLLCTSYAPDDLLSIDLGWRRVLYT